MALALGSIGAIAAIVLGLLFGWNMGGWFSARHRRLGYILYGPRTSCTATGPRSTSPRASLFSSVMLVFFYVLRMFLDRR